MNFHHNRNSGSGEYDIATSSKILNALHVGAVMQFLPRGISADVSLPFACRLSRVSRTLKTNVEFSQCRTRAEAAEVEPASNHSYELFALPLCYTSYSRDCPPGCRELIKLLP